MFKQTNKNVILNESFIVIKNRKCGHSRLKNPFYLTLINKDKGEESIGLKVHVFSSRKWCNRHNFTLK